MQKGGLFYWHQWASALPERTEFQSSVGGELPGCFLPWVDGAVPRKSARFYNSDIHFYNKSIYWLVRWEWYCLMKNAGILDSEDVCWKAIAFDEDCWCLLGNYINWKMVVIIEECWCLEKDAGECWCLSNSDDNFCFFLIAFLKLAKWWLFDYWCSWNECWCL